MWRIIGYSSVTPFAPRIVRASRAIVERLAHVVELAEADLRRMEALLVLGAADVEGKQRAFVELD